MDVAQYEIEKAWLEAISRECHDPAEGIKHVGN